MRNLSMRRLVGTGLVVGGLTMGVLIGPASSGAVTPKKASTTLNVAFSPGSVPTSLLPFYSGAQCTTTNIDYWNLEARPGYWFGLGNSVAIQYALSPLGVPTVKTVGANTVANVPIKGWNWSDAKGHLQKMTAEDVLFWLNMDKAQAQAGSANAACGYAPNFGIPDQVLSVTTPHGATGNEVSITFSGHEASLWIIYNQLSQLQPMPTAFDRTAHGAAKCWAEKWSAITNKGADLCSKVFTYLSGLKINNPLWAWSNGPYRQKSAGYAGATPDGNDVQVVNTHYSGPVKASGAKTIVYKPFTSVPTEVSSLQSNKLQFGYADPSDVGPSPGPGKAGPNKLPKMTGYKTVGTVLFGVFYWQFNYDNANSTYSTTGTPPAWASEENQQYFRGALASGIDQAGVISAVDNGYAVPSYSAIPAYPANSFAKGVTNPYPTSNHGKAVLAAHGWDTSTSPATCTAANCGTSAYPIPTGSKAELGLIVPSGDPAVTTATTDEVNEILSNSDIKIDVTYDTANNVQAGCFAGKGPDAAWQMCGYGGWIYAPDFYPSGEVLFAAGSSSNVGGYGNAEMTGLIAATTTNGSLALNQNNPTYGTSFAQWTATDLPFLWQPTPAGFIEQRRANSA
jgi:peptide/nickel transport system substrate-binding protein